MLVAVAASHVDGLICSASSKLLPVRPAGFKTRQALVRKEHDKNNDGGREAICLGDSLTAINIRQKPDPAI